VVFRVDAYRDREFEGDVIQVRNSPIMEDNVVHYETIISVDNSERLLKPGMTTEVSVITEERHDVLRVRNTAMRARLPDSIRPETDAEPEEGEALVYFLQDNEIIPKIVKTGLNDGVYTELTEGIEEGQTLVVGLSLRGDESGTRRSIITGEQTQY